MSTESGSAPSIVADLASVSSFGTRLHADDNGHTRHSTARERVRLIPQRRTAQRETESSHAHWHDRVLPTGEFEAGLHRETRRAERSKTPLSLLLYSVDASAADEPLHFERLLAVLQCSKRETDMLGHVGSDTLAVLCPDTDGEGTKAFMLKLQPLISGLPITATAATYPDHLFQSLEKGTSTHAAFEPFIVAPTVSEPVGNYTGKRLFDIVSALFVLCLIALPMLVVALLVKLTSRGPVIFKQTRLGKSGIPFTFYKFRSMVANVDDRIHREYMASLIRSGHGNDPTTDSREVVYKMKADPRITRIGKFIRMTSIDELPQLFNVLRGEMSMVGPRPPIPYEAAHYEPWHLRRILAAKPGITGLWQVEGRSRVTFSEMVRMDLRYIRQCTFRLDLKIMFKTISVVLRGDGAR
jgi:lipopolysaccharide/colanic/teichoic acid biosynthesis glycosyltransferase